MTSSLRCCRSWPAAAGRWVKTTPGWSPGCSSCCLSSSPAGPRRTCRRPGPRCCWPGSVPAVSRARPAAGLISDLERIYQREKDADKELSALLAATGTTRTDLHGIGPCGAARLLAEAGDVTRFPAKAHFASWDGTAPIDASCGDQVRHRLSRAGNRQINRVLHIMAVVQLRNPTQGRACHDRKVAAGKTPREAVRALNRRLPDVACHQMITDARRAGTGPGGHAGAATGSSAAGLHPSAGTSEKSLPGPASDDLTPGKPAHCPGPPRHSPPAPDRSRRPAQPA
jgi:transposase